MYNDMHDISISTMHNLHKVSEEVVWWVFHCPGNFWEFSKDTFIFYFVFEELPQ